MRPAVPLAALLAYLFLGANAMAADPDPAAACPPGKAPPLSLPIVRQRVAENREVTIVALGSSSTEGWRATDIAHSYPALLQADLNAALPTSQVAVLNRGIGGQDVSEELPRIERDALAARPALVIWQLGANGAMRHVAPELFKRLMLAGVKRMREARIDVVLMDNQKAPAILAVPDHDQFDQAMAEVAAETGAGLFARSALMDQWRDAGYPYARFVSDDGVHHNDYGYRCMTAALAGAIVDGLKSPVASAQTASSAQATQKK